MSILFSVLIAITDVTMVIGFFVLSSRIEELEDRVKTCESYNELDEKEIMALKGRCRDLEEKIGED